MLNFLIFLFIGIIFFLPALRNLKLRRYKKAGTFALLGLVTLSGIYICSDVYLTSLWYDNLGYASRYWSVLFLQAKLFLAGGFAAILLGVANVFFWYHGVKKQTGPWPVKENRSRFILFAGLLIQIPLFIIAGTISSAHWDEALLFFNAVPFGKEDPVFFKDIGFYIFKSPFFEVHRRFARQPLLLFSFACRRPLYSRECPSSHVPGICPGYP